MATATKTKAAPKTAKPASNAFFGGLVKPDAKKAAKKKDTKRQVAIEELKSLSAINMVMKSLEGIKSSIEDEVKQQIRTNFLEVGKALKAKPDNFRGVDKDDRESANASCEMKKRSTRSRLSGDEQELLDKHNISYSTEDDVTTTYLINPAYINDAELFNKLTAALVEIGAPTDLFQSQVGTPISTVTDESVREVFAAKVDDETRELLMQTVTTISVKSKFNGKLQDAFNVLNGLLSDDDTSEEDAE